MKQYEAVRQALENLGGIATLSQLNQEVFKIKDCEWKTKTPFASIRRIVQLDKEIYKIKPGLYALKIYRKKFDDMGMVPEMKSKVGTKEQDIFNHSYYQGILLEYGNLLGWSTFIPNQDKRKLYINKKLEELSNLKNVPSFTYDRIVKRASTIDVIWFNKRLLPNSFFEIEHSTDIQNSLIKFVDLQDFNTKMFIVADLRRKNEYETKLNYTAFDSIKKRVGFLDYITLYKKFELLLLQKSLNVNL